MQTAFPSGQFRLAAIQPSTQGNSLQDVLSSASANHTLKADVLSATLQQISQQQAHQQHSIAQYKAQIVIQGTIIDILTQFPLEKGDQLELRLTQNQQLSIEKVIPQTTKTELATSSSTHTGAVNTTSTAGNTGSAQNTPINQAQINNVIQMWLSQSRPASGALLDLSITMQAVAQIINQQPNAPQFGLDPTAQLTASASEQPRPAALSNLLLLIAQSIQNDVFGRLPHSGQADFKQQVQVLLKELVSWQSSGNQTSQTASAIPSASSALSHTPSTSTAASSQQMLVTGLTNLQGMLEQAINRQALSSSAVPSTNISPTQPTVLASAVHNSVVHSTVNSSGSETSNTHIPILRDWTQVLSLMTPATHNQADLLDWVLESIRRLSVTTPVSGEPGLNADTSQKSSVLTQSGLNPSALTQAQLQAAANNPTQEAQRAIDTSQWLRLAEFRKHQLFTGQVKQSLLQGTSEIQISNVLRQLLVSIEELTGRMTALRLASAGSQVDTNSPTHLHLDLPIMTHIGPTSVGIDITERQQDEETGNKKSIKHQWLVHLKFELPPLAPFISQIIYDVDHQQLTANFYCDHKETLSLLNEHLTELKNECKHHLSSEVELNTRFGMISMPRETIVKTTQQPLSVKV
jgi:hypothetical protein